MVMRIHSVAHCQMFISFGFDLSVLYFHMIKRLSFCPNDDPFLSYLLVRVYASHVGCRWWTCGCRAATPVRRGEHRGDGYGNIDDSILHDCFICIVVRIIIIIFCRIEISHRNRQTEFCRLLLIYALQYLRDRQLLSFGGLYFHALALNSNPN